MVIAPSTNINLLSNIPLDTSYDHTIFFASPDGQRDWFSSKTKYALKNYTYQRYNDGSIAVGISADNLYDCNYLMFQNTAFGNKWFYAYIKSVDYVNNDTSRITYEIDVMQTWFFDYEMDFCFVERTHTGSDLIGEHIEPESVDIGELVFNDYSPVSELTTLAVIMAIVDAQDGVHGNLYDNIYGGATLWAFPYDDVDGINTKLEEFLDSPESVIGLYTMPQAFLASAPSYGGEKLDFSTPGVLTIDSNKPSSTTTLDGYTPHNCKLYTYPFNFWQINNGAGSGLALRYEMFDASWDVGRCNIYGTITQPVSVSLYPRGYKGVGPGQPNVAESLSVNSFPLCSWNMDTYKAWIAQNSIPIALNATGTAAQILAGAAFTGGNPLPALGLSAISQATAAISQGYRASIAADMSKGNFNNGGVNSANKINTFFHGRMSVNRYMAQCIDNYMDMYGYSINRVMNPMRNARPNWTYIKTIGCTLTGSVPADDMKRLVDIYNAGVTFWIDGDKVGQYNLPNLATIRG